MLSTPLLLLLFRDQTCWRLPTVAPWNGADFFARLVARVDLPHRDAVALDVVLPFLVGVIQLGAFPSVEELAFPLVADDLLPVERVLLEQGQPVLLHGGYAELFRFPRVLYGVCVVTHGHELVPAHVAPSAVVAVLLTFSSVQLSSVVP